MPRFALLLTLLLGTWCLAAATCAVAGPALEASVDRAIMFDRHFGNSEEGLYGSRTALLRGELVRYSPGTNLKSYHGYTVFVPCREHLSKSAVNALVASGRATAVKGLLLEQCSTDTANEEALALFFATSSSPVPIYFLPHGATSQELSTLLTNTAAHSVTDSVVLSVGKNARVAAPTANLTLPSALIESTFTNRAKEARKLMTPLPHVLVTAHYDTLSVAPASHTSAGASGAVAAMELWRRITAAPSLSEDGATGGTNPYAVTMLLGSTARFNYAGTSAWIAQQADADLDRFQVVLCLDELLPSPDAAAGSADLYLHVQDVLTKRPQGQQVVQFAEALAKAYGIQLTVVPAKTNYQHHDLRFEHEVFASRQMSALTFSTRRTHLMDQVFRNSRRSPVTAEEAAQLARRVDFIEALVQLLTASPRTDANADQQWPGSASYMEGMLTFAAASSRSPVAENGAGLKAYATAVERQMRTQAATTQRAALSSASSTVSFHRLRMPGITLFGPYTETMTVFIAKSYLYEGVIAVASAVALCVFLYMELGIEGIKGLIVG